jgi:hypothetical protein
MSAVRTSSLSEPWFLLAVGVLVLNDHVFKDVWPGTTTGKLSDLAGLVVIAVLASLPLGRTVGSCLAGVGFAALKISPAVAQFAVPILGGFSRCDLSDLVALAVLPATWWAMGRPQPSDAVRRGQRGRTLKLLGLVAAVFAVSATSAPMEQISRLEYRDGAFEAFVNVPNRAAIMRSVDGGRTWTAELLPDSDWDVKDASWAQSVCATDGVCYRVGQDDPANNEPGPTRVTTIDRQSPAGDWTAELRFGDGRVNGLVIDPNDSSKLMFRLDTGRQLGYRSGPGHWERVDLISLAEDAIDPRRVTDRIFWSVLGWGLLAVVGGLIVRGSVRRHRTRPEPPH